MDELDELFRQAHGIGLKEASVLCHLDDVCLTSSEIAKCVEMKASNASKTIGSVEKKGLIMRRVGVSDKRLMCFSLTLRGRDLIAKIKTEKIAIPEILRGILDVPQTQ